MLSENAAQRQPQMQEEATTESLSVIREQLLRYCELLGGSRHEAEDIVQTTLLKALPFLEGVEQHPNVTALLRRIAKNTWFDHVRKQGKHLACSQLELSAQFASGPEVERPLEIEEALQVVVNHLPSRQRIVFLLCEVFEFTDREVAELFGMSKGAVKAMLHRARANLHSLHKRLRLREDTEPQREILQAYVAAFRSADIEALIHLCEDGTLDPVLATSKVLTFAQSQKTATGRKRGIPTAMLQAA